MSDFRFIDDNKFFDTSLTVTATSENPEFPVSNLQKHSRSYVWKSYGYFDVDIFSKWLDFDEGSGQVSASITVGTYTASALASEIETQMNAVGSNTYTVSFSCATGKWTITSNGATLSLLWATGTHLHTSIGSTIGFDVSSDDTGSTSYTGDNVAIHSYDRVTIDLGSATAIDSFCIFFDPLRDLPYSGSETILLQANTSDSWSLPALTQTITIDTTWRKASHFFDTDQTYRYWSIKITDPQNSNCAVELPVVVLGKATVLSQVPSMGFQEKSRDNSKARRTAYGHEYWDVYPVRRRLSFAYKAISQSDKQTLKQIFDDVGMHTPIVVAWDTGESIFSDKEEYLMYGRFSSDFKEAQRFTSYFDLKIDITECI